MALSEGSARDDVNVQVEYGLARISAVVDDQAERIRHAQLLSHLAGRQQQMTQQGLVVLVSVYQAGNFPLGDYQHVDRGLRIDIVYRNAVIVLIEELTGNLTTDDLAKNGI
jgi:hypothetical protein